MTSKAEKTTVDYQKYEPDYTTWSEKKRISEVAEDLIAAEKLAYKHGCFDTIGYIQDGLKKLKEYHHEVEDIVVWDASDVIDLLQECYKEVDKPKKKESEEE